MQSLQVPATAAALLLDRTRLTAADVMRFGREFGLVPLLASPAELMQVGRWGGGALVVRS